MLTTLSSLSLSPQSSKGYDEGPEKKKGRVSVASCLLFVLPGETRNQIYRHVLLLDRPFAIQVQPGSRETALLRVNKQIYAEASSIFYHENTFRFPRLLFVGGPILVQLVGFHNLSLISLEMMRTFVLDIPVKNFPSCSMLKTIGRG